MKRGYTVYEKQVNIGLYNEDGYCESAFLIDWGGLSGWSQLIAEDESYAALATCADLFAELAKQPPEAQWEQGETIAKLDELGFERLP